jgi:hypothetical protein
MSRAILELPSVDRMPPLPADAIWLNSEPLSPEDLRGKVVLVSFWTYTCINWLRTLPYLRAWWDKYQKSGLVLIGVHTPEFSFEHNIDNIGQIAFRFHARDVNLVMGPIMRGGTVDFTVTLDDQSPGSSHGTDVSADGKGLAIAQRLYQLIRQPDPTHDRTFAIMFHSAGVQAPVFTFG